jgi:hypothetical protein
MNRKPPSEILKILREEANFGCPIPGCGNPYLTWHHFDPPWKIKEHHDPTGMIALCRDHHDKADAGLYTIDQLRELKNNAKSNNQIIQSKFEWLRREIITMIGSNIYSNTPVIFEYNNEPIIWYNRSKEGYMLLNIRMDRIFGKSGLIIEDNYWVSYGKIDDLECPPNGKALKVTFQKINKFKIIFHEIISNEDFHNKISSQFIINEESYPIVFLEIDLELKTENIIFNKLETNLGGAIIKNIIVNSCKTAISYCK